jgi:hypothetical protein
MKPGLFLLLSLVFLSDYQCELVDQSRWFRGRGFAAITADGVLLWVDKRGKVAPVKGFSEHE